MGIFGTLREILVLAVKMLRVYFVYANILKLPSLFFCY